jgi:hypothetical protein
VASILGQAKSRRNAREWMAGNRKPDGLETLVAVAIAVGMLKGHAAPAAEPPKTVTVEQRATPAPKPQPQPHHRSEPSLGF